MRELSVSSSNSLMPSSMASSSLLRIASGVLSSCEISANHLSADSASLSSVLARILKSLDNLPSSSLFVMLTLVLNSPLIRLRVARANFRIGPLIFCVRIREIIAAINKAANPDTVSYTHLRAHET